MNILLVDSDPLALENLAHLCQDADRTSHPASFTDPALAVDYAVQHPVELVFLEMRLPGMTGPELLQKLRALHPALQAAFVAASEQYAMDAWRADACAFLLKPVSLTEVRQTLIKAHRLQLPVRLNRPELRTFGRFDLFCNGQAVKFKNRKAHELLALLTARWGGVVTIELAIERLWEGEAYTEPVKVKYRKAVMNLRETLAEHGLLWMLHSARGQLWLETQGVDCDYFRLLNGDAAALALFHGAFMSDYSWSEYYIPMLDHIAESYHPI